MYELEVMMVARSRAILNDATMADAEAVGLRRAGQSLKMAFPCLSPAQSYSSFPQKSGISLGASDLVISEGGANFETLWDEQELNGRISFLIHEKCRHFCVPRSVSAGTLLVENQQGTKGVPRVSLMPSQTENAYGGRWVREGLAMPSSSYISRFMPIGSPTVVVSRDGSRLS